MLNESNTPLFEGFLHYKLFMCVRLIAHNSNYNVLNNGVDDVMKILLDATLFKYNLPACFFKTCGCKIIVHVAVKFNV